MSEKITFQQLIDEFAEKSGRTKAFSNKFIKDIFISIQEGLRKDENVNIKGLGIFKLQEVAERETLNPKTGRSALIEAHKKIVFRPEKALREKVNEKYADLEPVVLEKKEDKPVPPSPAPTPAPKPEPSPKPEEKAPEENIPTFPKPEPSENRKPITSSITNADGSIDIKKIFGGDDLPSDEEIKKENPAFSEDLSQTSSSVNNEQKVDDGPQSFDELLKITKAAQGNESPEAPAQEIIEEKKEEKVNISFEGNTGPQVFGENKTVEPEPDLSANLPWLNKDDSIVPPPEEASISPTFIIEKREKRSPWRWVFPLVLVILILAVIFIVPNNSFKFEDIAFWKNWEKISLFERKDKQDKNDVAETDKEAVEDTKKNDNKGFQNIFLKLKNYKPEENVVQQEKEKVQEPVEENKVVQQAPRDEEVLIHIIQPGNTLWGLSKHYYDRSSLWPNIYRKNIEILPTPDFLPLGRELLIPELYGNSHELSKSDSARIAQGYYLAYTAYKKYDESKAKGYLDMAKRFSTTIK